MNILQVDAAVSKSSQMTGINLNNSGLCSSPLTEEKILTQKTKFNFLTK